MKITNISKESKKESDFLIKKSSNNNNSSNLKFNISFDYELSENSIKMDVKQFAKALKDIGLF